MAEQLEHIKSSLLIERLDRFLGMPRFDPHGDPIPNDQGEIIRRERLQLSQLSENCSGLVVGVKDSNPDFLQYLDRVGIHLGLEVRVLEKIVYDGSLLLSFSGKQVQVSREVAGNIYITDEN